MAPIWGLCQILLLVLALLLGYVLATDITINLILPTSKLAFLFLFILLSRDFKRHFRLFPENRFDPDKWFCP
jgi:hypothetical protein